VLISFDGWRADYTLRAAVPNLRALAARGVRAEALLSTFPSKTFPAHYTIVTGLYPERHGIVSNAIRDPAFPERFTMTAATSRDPRWWGGEPLWVTAIRQGRRSASMFWPGSEVAIAGVRPTSWRTYDSSFPNGDRVRQVLEWLALPESERPSFITLYFSDVDSAGHDFGPDSPQVMTAAARLDALLGRLMTGLEGLHLVDRTTVVVVSDHGMSQLDAARVVFLDDYVDPAMVDVVQGTPILELAPRGMTVDQLYERLKDKHPALDVYRREELPEELHHGHNQRIAPIIGIAEDGWTVTSHQPFEGMRATGQDWGGDHGYDPRLKSMHALFVAAGPRLHRGRVIPELRSVDLYEFFCRILSLTPAVNDGDASATHSFFVD
jgi:predicted AlkP superfamily pyrophosphatase or phosphodiesterase